MNLRWLKWLRVVVAALVLAGLTLAFIGPAHFPHRIISAFTSFQIVPSGIALLTGAGVALGAVAILLLTLVAGRVYCSALCPLGILQDLIFRIASRLRGRPIRLRHAPARPWIRHLFFWGTLITLPLGGAGLAIAWLDPYSQFGRLISVLVRPAVLAVNNLLVAFGLKLPWLHLNHAEIILAPTALLVGMILFLLGLIALSAWKGRLYCNTICPVGTGLGFLASRSFLKLKISADACGKCAECLKSCKAQCIDLKAGTVDHSRCVACYNCLTACDRGAMRLESDWSRKQKSDESASSFDTGRRQFLLTAASGAILAGATLPTLARAKDKDDDHKEHEKPSDDKKGHGGPRKYSNVITPPLAGDTESFLAKCTACQLCVSSCSTGVLQPSLFHYGAFDLLKPHMDYTRAFCNYTCHRCTEVCPSGALPFLPVAQKQITRIGMAHFKRDNCIVYRDHTDCGACSEHCPTKAVHMVPFEDGLVIPEVDKSLCIGCGACEFACPAETKAIVVHGAPKNKLARRPTSDQPIQPTTPKNGFPF